MGDELSLLLEIFNKIEKAGGQATLCVATGGGKTKVKLEITTTPAPPTSSGRRQRRRGPQARARRNQRAAAHQAALAGRGSNKCFTGRSSPSSTSPTTSLAAC